jgi:hypothetical protein
MKRKTLFVVLCSAIAGACNVGMAPEGMSREQAKNALEKLSPEEQIKYVATSPMPPDMKEKRYREIEEKTGVSAKDVLGQGYGAPQK